MCHGAAVSSSSRVVKHSLVMSLVPKSVKSPRQAMPRQSSVVACYNHAAGAANSDFLVANHILKVSVLYSCAYGDFPRNSSDQR